MPYVWEDNAVAFEINGVTIYHVYEYDMACEPTRDHLYHVSPYGSERDEECFDIRSIPEAEGMDPADHEAVLRYAIEQGWLTQMGLVLPTPTA